MNNIFEKTYLNLIFEENIKSFFKKQLKNGIKIEILTNNENVKKILKKLNLENSIEKSASIENMLKSVAIKFNQKTAEKIYKILDENNIEEDNKEEEEDDKIENKEQKKQNKKERKKKNNKNKIEAKPEQSGEEKGKEEQKEQIN